LINNATQNYVRQHADEDVRMLALRGCKDPAVDLTVALQQIQGRQTARRKLPSWAAIDGILYPPHLNMEQCSSEHTARYKAALCRRLLSSHLAPPHTVPRTPVPRKKISLLDLTGGFGVDFTFMSEVFDEATYVERDEELCALSTENFKTMDKAVRTICDDGTEVLHQTDHATVIFLDPARRDEHGGRTYGIADCTPNVLELKDELLQKAAIVILKLSPMLDWRKAVEDLGADVVREVHIVSVDNECKELLLVLSSKGEGRRLYCVNDDQMFGFSRSEYSEYSEYSDYSDYSDTFLYEPNASIMKAGCFGAVAATYKVRQLAPNSHLFLSDRLIADFPGRSFQVKAVSTMNKQDLKRHLQGIRQANITVRNFPLSVAELRKRLKLADGGSTYIFATTNANDERVLLITEKAKD